MRRFIRAASSVARTGTYFFEPLERRVLLDGDPVIVLTEAFSLTTFENVNSSTVRPWLWENPQEYLWDLDLGDWNTTDGDGNGYPDDAYGWNFGGGGSPNIIGPHGGLNSAAHGAAIMGWVLGTLNGAGSQGDRVRIMHVIGAGDQIVPYVLGHKAQGVNIVAVSNSSGFGSTFSRADAQALGDEGILLFVGSSNAGFNADEFVPVSNWSFYHATPRFGTQQPPVHTIIPATTNPAVHPTDYGINSFYFAAPNTEAQSYAEPVAATYAAIAVQAYQDANNGASPTAEQIKRAMMSGVSYISGLDNRTITHDYVNDQRQDGGLLNLDGIITSINQTTPEITDVSMTPLPNPVGTTVSFNLNASIPPSNWTISWGDNSFDDQSGVQVRPGTQSSIQHTFLRDIQPHYYYPTIYAMSDSKQVYLPEPSAQVEVFFDTGMGLTAGQDNYVLSRDGDNLVVTLGTLQQTFAPGELPRTALELGEGGDTVTIDFTNDDPLEFTDLSVRGSAQNQIRIIGSPDADTIDNRLSTIIANGTAISKGQSIAVYIDGAGGDDYLRSASGAGLTTLIGGAGDDVIDLVASVAVVSAGGGNDILNVNTGGVDAARARITGSETFAAISIFTGGGIVMDQDGGFVLRTEALNIEEGAFLDLADNNMIVDNPEPPPLSAIQPLLQRGYNDGAWNGEGIRSSVAASAGNTALGFALATDIFTSFPATFAGQVVDETAVLIKYTLYGDADLNGMVTLPDFNRLAANFGTESGARWSQGDFDFDTDVDLDDFNLLVGNWGQGGSGLNGPSGFGNGPSGFDNGTYGYTVEDLLEHLLNGGHGLTP